MKDRVFHDAPDSMSDNPLSISGLWYMEAVSTGAMAITQLERGISSGNLKQFVAMTAISALAGRQGISHLCQYLDLRQAETAEG